MTRESSQGGEGWTRRNGVRGVVAGLALLFAAGNAVACGSDGDATQGSGGLTTETSGALAPEVSLEAGPGNRFTPGYVEIGAEALSDGKVVFEVVSTEAEGGADHELVVGSPDGVAVHGQMMEDMAGMDMEGMHHDTEGLYADVVEVAPGEIVTVVATVPEGVLELVYGCGEPGHMPSMLGEVQVTNIGGNSSIVAHS